METPKSIEGTLCLNGNIFGLSIWHPKLGDIFIATSCPDTNKTLRFRYCLGEKNCKTIPLPKSDKALVKIKVRATTSPNDNRVWIPELETDINGFLILEESQQQQIKRVFKLRGLLHRYHT